MGTEKMVDTLKIAMPIGPALPLFKIGVGIGFKNLFCLQLLFCKKISISKAPVNVMSLLWLKKLVEFFF